MNKKAYFSPKATIVALDATAFLAGSTGATGEDVPWAARKRNTVFEDDDNEQ